MIEYEELYEDFIIEVVISFMRKNNLKKIEVIKDEEGFLYDYEKSSN